MNHCKGYMTSKLAPPEFRSNSIDHKSEVFSLCYENSNYDVVKDHKFKSINQVIKNSIRGGHSIQVQILDQQGLSIDNQAGFNINCIFKIEMYRELKE